MRLAVLQPFGQSAEVELMMAYRGIQLESMKFRGYAAFC